MADNVKTPSPQSLLEHAQDGWWPYLAGREASTEATAWCAMACRKNEESTLKSLQYLISIQNKDGGWATRAGTEPSDWSTGIALLAIQVLQKALLDGGNLPAKLGDKTASVIRDGAVYLLRSRADFISDASRITMFMLSGSDFDYPRGWSWSPNTYHWIEPTANAVLALQMSPLAGEKRYKLALKEAQEYFFQKVCVSGGWNYGVPISVNANIPSQIVPTAWVLIALHDTDNAKIAQAIKLLNTTNDVTTQTLQAQALSIMALAAHGVTVEDRVETLKNHFSDHTRMAKNFMVAGMCTIACSLPSDGNPLLSKSS